MSEVILLTVMGISLIVVAVAGVSMVNTKNTKPKPLDKLDVKEIDEALATITEQMTTLEKDIETPVKSVGEDIALIEKKVSQLYENEALALGQAKILTAVLAQLKVLRTYSPKLTKEKD